MLLHKYPGRKIDNQDCLRAGLSAFIDLLSPVACQPVNLVNCPCQRSCRLDCLTNEGERQTRMSLHFQDYADVPLANSPLVEVICQVQFSPILRIGVETPARVQDALRGRFPRLSVNHGFAIDATGLVAGETPAVVRRPGIYRFSTPDDSSAVSLSQDFFALSTEAYTVWPHFVANLEHARDAIMAEYHSLNVTRIGLRYVNHFSPSRLGLSRSEEVLSLLDPSLVELLRPERPWSTPTSFATQVDLDAEEGTLSLRLWFDGRNSEAPLVLDFDYYQEGVLVVNDLGERCGRFHSAIYSAFRWAIVDDQTGVFQLERTVSHDRRS